MKYKGVEIPPIKTVFEFIEKCNNGDFDESLLFKVSIHMTYMLFQRHYINRYENFEFLEVVVDVHEYVARKLKVTLSKGIKIQHLRYIVRAYINGSWDIYIRSDYVFHKHKMFNIYACDPNRLYDDNAALALYQDNRGYTQSLYIETINRVALDVLTHDEYMTFVDVYMHKKMYTETRLYFEDRQKCYTIKSRIIRKIQDGLDNINYMEL